MKQYKNVQSSATIVKPLEVNVDTTYIRSNIQRIETEDFTGWQYDEIQYTNKEYIEILAQQEDVKAIESRILTPIEIYNRLDIESTPLEELKLHKKNQLDYLCTQTIFGRFEVELDNNTYEFSFDTEAQLRFTGIAVLFGNGQIDEIEWTTYLNGERIRIPLTATEFNKVSQAALVHQNSNIVKYNNLLKEVDKCETKEEVESIVW